MSHPEYLRLVPASLPDVHEGESQETGHATYQITLYPFSNHPVTVYFRLRRRLRVPYGASQGFPRPWAVHVENMNGPQTNGVDMDNTFYRMGGTLRTYREHINECLNHIVLHSYGGPERLRRDYPDKLGVVVL